MIEEDIIYFGSYPTALEFLVIAILEDEDGYIYI